MSKYELPEIAADVNAEEARALHRCVRAMHDGQCPYCSRIFQLEEVRSRNPHYAYICPSCQFFITPQEVRAIEEVFRPFMRRCAIQLLNWREEREQREADQQIDVANQPPTGSNQPGD